MYREFLQKHTALRNLNVSHLDKLFYDQQGFVKALDSALILSLNPIELKVWARENGVYQFITTELIAWLQDRINGRSAIEICAGKGTISRNLAIPGTDSRLLDESHIKYRIEKAGEVSTNPPDDILTFDSIAAVKHYKPEVVIGAFVTQLYKQGENTDLIPSSPYGTNEELLLQCTDTYIMIGNKSTHKAKHIFRKKHREYAFPWLINRSEDQALNRIWVWDTSKRLA